MDREKRDRKSASERERRKKRRDKRKHGLECAVCGESDVVCLDFHHLDPTKKEGKMAELISTANEERWTNELSKCLVLCANCHRKFHAGRLQL